MRWPVALVLLCIAGPAAAQDAAKPDVVLRQSLDPTTGAVIGQHVTLYVDVLFRGAMPYPPRVRLPDVAGLQAFRFETQATTISDSIAGESYVGQRFEFALYPRRGGSYVIPPAEATLLDGQGNAAGNAKGEQAGFDVTVPLGVDVSQPVVATQHLTLSEQWMPEPKGKFKAGDAIVRTVTRSAEDVPGLAMLDLDMSAPDGVRAYADPPDIEDHAERGVITGRRVDRVTYVFERGGHFTLPTLSQPWWDLGESAVKSADAQGVTVEVADAPMSAPAEAGRPATAARVRFLAGGAVLFVALSSGAWLVARRRRASRPRPGDEAFSSLRRACATANPSAVYRAFTQWRFHLAAGQQTDAIAAASHLRTVLFAGDRGAWTKQDSTELYERCKTIRRSHPSAIPDPVLPALNPIGVHEA
jgi:hypothetical protein